MLNKCEYKKSDDALTITVPKGLDIIPGRLIRRIISNLESEFELFEYSFVKGKARMQEMDDVKGFVPLETDIMSKMLGQLNMVVFQNLHQSMYDPTYVQLHDDEIEVFKDDLPPGEDFYEEDFTVSMPADFFLICTDNIEKFIDVTTHLRLKDFPAVRDAAAKLSIASITIYDESEMMVEFTEPDIPDIIFNGCEEFLKPPMSVTRIDF